MQCLDFERFWNERLDARGAAEGDAIARELDAHEASCDSCRAIAQRYRTLQQVIRAWGPPPAPPAGFAGRFLEAQDAGAAPVLRIHRLRRLFVPLAVAASLLVAVVVAGRSGPSVRRTRGPSETHAAKGDDARSLAEALALARSATWELARETSGPAARIGREVLDSAAISPESSLSADVPTPPASDVLQRVGSRVQEGVAPLSGSARHAFGFLLGGATAGEPAASPPT